jgi:hypothetical protein
MRAMPHGQDDQNPVLWNNGASNGLIGNHTYRCVRTNEYFNARWISLFSQFTDDLSRYGYVYLMKHKSETFEKFKEFQNEVKNHRNRKIKFPRSDRGDE